MSAGVSGFVGMQVRPNLKSFHYKCNAFVAVRPFIVVPEKNIHAQVGGRQTTIADHHVFMFQSAKMVHHHLPAWHGILQHSQLFVYTPGRKGKSECDPDAQQGGVMSVFAAGELGSFEQSPT